MEPTSGKLNHFEFATSNSFVTASSCVCIMDHNHLSNSGIVSVSLIEAKLPLCSPRWRSVVPSSSRGDPFALRVPGVAIFLDSKLTWFPVVPSLNGGATAAGAVVYMNTTASDHAGYAWAQIAHIHFERPPIFLWRIKAYCDSTLNAGICQNACYVVWVGRFHVGLEAFQP